MNEMTPAARAALNGSIKTAQEMGYEPQASAPRIHTCDDMGNGYRFANQHAQKALHVDGIGWMAYDGKRWGRDEKGVMLMAKATAQGIWDEANEARKDTSETGADKAKRLAAWAHRSRSNGTLTAMLAQAESETSANVNDFDAQPYLFNCQNGTLNLDTLELKPHDPADRLTKLSLASYTPGAPCPRWNATIERFMPDADIRAFMQRSFGAALFGRGLKQFWFLYGPIGDNGKTTILRAVSSAMGDYARSIGIDSLCDGKRSAGDESEIAELAGARLVQSEETNGHKLNENLIKRMSGEGDQIQAKLMGQNRFNFDVTFKLFMFGNNRPRMSGTDKALWRRVLCVPFLVSIPKHEQVDNYAEQLAAERDGILAWLIAGYVAWRRDGLKPPLPVIQATAEHQAENDELGQFINENAITGSAYSIRVTAFKEAFYATGATMRPRELARQMRERYGEPQRGNGGVWYYTGIGLMNPE